MNRTLLALCAALTVIGGSTAIAAPASHHVVKHTASKSMKAAKIIDVWTCPINMDHVTAKTQSGKPQVIGHFRVHFCCGSCPPTWAKLSAKQKMAKAEAAYKMDLASKKAASSKKK